MESELETYRQELEEKSLDSRPIEPKEGRIRDLIFPKKNLSNKLGLLMCLFSLNLLISGYNYGLAKGMNQEEGFSRERIERKIQELPSKGRRWIDKATLFALQQGINTGYWGREYYYREHNLK